MNKNDRGIDVFVVVELWEVSWFYDVVVSWQSRRPQRRPEIDANKIQEGYIQV